METLSQYWTYAVAVLGILAVAMPIVLVLWHKFTGTDAPLWLSRLADVVAYLANLIAARDSKTAETIAAGATAELDAIVGKLPEGIRDTAKLLVIQGRAAIEADLKKLLSK